MCIGQQGGTPSKKVIHHKGEQILRIDSSNVGMESTRRYSSVQSSIQVFTMASLSTTKVSTGDIDKKKENLREIINTGMDESATSAMENSMLGLKNGFKNIGSIRSVPSRDLSDTMGDIREKCIEFLLLIFFKGEKSDILSPEIVNKQAGAEDKITSDVKMLSVYTKYNFEEEENTTFSTTGKVVTAEGKEISFNLDLQMTRKFSEYYEEKHDIMEIHMCDPLVINLDCNIASLDDQKFTFDIDGDGIQDTISSLNKSSGYLAVDKNGDGTINDGSELFGTSSGDGFKDLAEFDSDGNGWIDENDVIWDKLLIWTKDETGKDALYHLKKEGVGAICLQNVSSNFSLNSLKTNQINGAIRNTGIFLYENGNVGTVAHMDLAK